jgi:hypothetical protein
MNEQAWTLIREGRFDEAVKQYDLIIAVKPEASYYSRRGLAYFGMKNYHQAIEDYNHAIALDKSNASVFYRRALVFDRTGQYGSAIEDFKTAAHLNPSKAKEYQALASADILSMQGKSAERAANPASLRLPPPFQSGLVATDIPHAGAGVAQNRDGRLASTSSVDGRSQTALSQNNTAGNHWVAYANNKVGLSISYPSDWALSERSTNDYVFKIEKPNFAYVAANWYPGVPLETVSHQVEERCSKLSPARLPIAARPIPPRYPMQGVFIDADQLTADGIIRIHHVILSGRGCTYMVQFFARLPDFRRAMPYFDSMQSSIRTLR